MKLCGGWKEERWMPDGGLLEARRRLDGGLVYRLVHKTGS